MKRKKDYSLREAYKACNWYKTEYGIDHSHLIGMMRPGVALNDIVDKLYDDSKGPQMGVNTAYRKKRLILLEVERREHLTPKIGIGYADENDKYDFDPEGQH